MEFAVNYSLKAADLLHQRRIQLDRFKCPAWPDLVADVQATYPTYVHFPLKVGRGIGDAICIGSNQPAGWKKVEMLLAQTDTPMVNVHLGQCAADYPDIPIASTDPAHVEMLTGHLIRDVRAVVDRFGPERVIIENDHDSGDRHLLPAFLPETIWRVVEETGCGLLLDLSHARLAARRLGLDAREYTRLLPVTHIREIHITGVQHFDGYWVNLLRRAGISDGTIQHYAGRLLDHLPMTDRDWAFFAWAMEQIHSGNWAQPWVVTFEYGGVGPLFKAITDSSVLAEQVPRLYELVKGEAASRECRTVSHQRQHALRTQERCPAASLVGDTTT